SGELYKVAEFLKDFLNDSIEVEGFTGTKTYGNIYLHLNDSILGKEAYELDINEEFIQLKAKDPEGIFRGIQTIRQLLPVSVNDSVQHIGTGTITDAPMYEYRGAMLDVARHFFNVDDVKTFI